ncbi:histidine phosphatase family protein, partial [Reinekea sp.]
MKVIYLIRHGQASFGQADYDQLSPLGYEQSTLLGASLRSKEISFDHIEQGTLLRHQQTFLAALGDRTVTTNALWNEFDHRDITNQYLQVQGTKVDEFLQLSDADKLAHFARAILLWVDNNNDRLEYNETWMQFKARITQALTETIASTKSCALVFTSGGTISSVIGSAFNFTASQTLKLNLQLVNTGVTKILVSSNGINVSTINEYTHLEQK